MDEESVDLTPGVGWTEAQLVVVRDLGARVRRAEAALARVEELAAMYASDSHCWTRGDDIAATIRRAVEGGRPPAEQARYLLLRVREFEATVDELEATVARLRNGGRP